MSTNALAALFKDIKEGTTWFVDIDSTFEPILRRPARDVKMELGLFVTFNHDNDFKKYEDNLFQVAHFMHGLFGAFVEGACGLRLECVAALDANGQPLTDAHEYFQEGGIMSVKDPSETYRLLRRLIYTAKLPSD